MIELRNINKSYNIGENTLHVLKDVSMYVAAGEFVTILGASGSGKKYTYAYHRLHGHIRLWHLFYRRYRCT